MGCVFRSGEHGGCYCRSVSMEVVSTGLVSCFKSFCFILTSVETKGTPLITCYIVQSFVLYSQSCRFLLVQLFFLWVFASIVFEVTEMLTCVASCVCCACLIKTNYAGINLLLWL